MLSVSGTYKDHNFLYEEPIKKISNIYKTQKRPLENYKTKVNFPVELVVIKTKTLLCVYFKNNFPGYYSDIVGRIPKIHCECPDYPEQLINDNYFVILGKHNSYNTINIINDEEISLGMVNYDFNDTRTYFKDKSLINNTPSLIEFQNIEMGQKILSSNKILTKHITTVKLTKRYTNDLYTYAKMANAIMALEPRYSIEITEKSFLLHWKFYYNKTSIPFLISNYHYRNFFKNESDTGNKYDYNFITAFAKSGFNYGSIESSYSFKSKLHTKYWVVHDINNYYKYKFVIIKESENP